MSAQLISNKSTIFKKGKDTGSTMRVCTELADPKPRRDVDQAGVAEDTRSLQSWEGRGPGVREGTPAKLSTGLSASIRYGCQSRPSSSLLLSSLLTAQLLEPCAHGKRGEATGFEPAQAWPWQPSAE